MERLSSRLLPSADRRPAAARTARLHAGRSLAAATGCALGFFALALTGVPKPAAVVAILLLAGGAFAVLIAALTALAAAAESALGRAWAGGFRALPAEERGRHATVARARAYARVLWLANAAALWIAALTSR